MQLSRRERETAQLWVEYFWLGVVEKSLEALNFPLYRVL